jgi:hypothetical protein
LASLHFSGKDNLTPYHLLHAKPLSDKREGTHTGVGMDAITIIEWLQSLLILAIFLGIMATSFKVWRWNYMTPPR